MPSLPATRKASALCQALEIVEARIRYNRALSNENEEIEEFRTNLKRLEMIAGIMNNYYKDENSNRFILFYDLKMKLHGIEEQNFRKKKQQQDRSSTPLLEIGDMEYSTYKNIMAILDEAGIFGNREEEFLGTYVAFENAKNGCYIKFTEQFERLLKKQKNEIDRHKADLNNLPDEYGEIANDMMIMLSYLLEVNDICMSNLKRSIVFKWNTEFKLICDTYLQAYTYKSKVGPVFDHIKDVVKEANSWKDRQQKLKEDKETRQREELKQEKQRKKQLQKAAAQQTAFEKEEAAKILLQVEQKKKEQKLADEKNLKYENELSKEQRRLAHLRWKQEVEAKKIQKEIAEMDEQRQLKSELLSKRTVSNDNGVLSSKFRLPGDVVKKYENEIAWLFSLDCKAMSYKKAVTLIEGLGGKVEVATGSSHQKIIFGGVLYQYLEKQEQHEKLVAGLPRPHNGETELKRFELGLLKDLLRSIVPENFLVNLNPYMPKKNMESNYKLKA